MPLLDPGPSLYSASTLKFMNFCFDTRLLARSPLVNTPHSIDQFIGRSGFCTPMVSSVLPLKSATGAPKVCVPLALSGGHDGGRTPTQLTTRSVGAAFGSPPR